MFVTLLLLFCSIISCHGWWSANNSVTASKIVRIAQKYDGTGSWNKTGCKHGEEFCDEWKCNLFVNDVLKEARAVVPFREWWIYSPIPAIEWSNERCTFIIETKCYTNVSQPQPGDIVAFQLTPEVGHVGIVTHGNRYISAWEYIVEEKSIPWLTEKVYWRYKYSKIAC